MPGGYVNTGSPTSLTLAHPGTTAPNEALFVAVAVSPLSSGYGFEDFTRGLTYNGSDLVSLGAVDCTSDRNGWVELFYLAPNLPPGDNDLEFTVSAPVSSILMESVSYSNVSQVTPGSVTTVTGTGASLSVTVQSAPSKFVVGAFACSAPILMQQIISFGGATGGSGVVSFKGQPATIAHDASATTVQSALQALSTIGTGNVTVTGSGPWTATFENVLANSAQPPFSIDGSGLTGGGPVSVDSPDGYQLMLQNIANTDSGNLLLIDSPGAAAVTLTAKTNSYATWADWGVVACSVDAIGAAMDDHQNVVNGVYNALTNTTATENQPASSVQDGLSDYLSGQHAALTGNSPVAVSASDVNAATATHVTTVTQNVAAATQNIGGLTGLTVASLNEALQRSAIGSGAGAGGGVYETVNFASYANQSTMSGIFTPGSASLSDSGTSFDPLNIAGLSPPSVTQMGITSGAVTWQSSTTFGYDFEYYPTETTTDYQVVSMTLGTVNNGGATALVGRSNNTMGTCVVGFVGGGFAVIGCFVSGSYTLFDKVTHTPVAGALYELVLGVESSSNLYGMQLLCNGTPLISLVDSSHISTVDSGHRFAGLGMVEGKNFGPTALVPPTVTSWGVADNAPPAVIGSGFRAYRTTTASLGTGSPSLLPNSWYDTVEWNTGDLTYAAGAANQLTIGIAGWYDVTINFQNSSFFSGSSSAYFGSVLYKNGSVWARGTTLSAGQVWNDHYSVFCVAGDTLQPGFIAPSSGFGTGATSGDGNFWSVTLQNCGTLS